MRKTICICDKCAKEADGEKAADPQAPWSDVKVYVAGKETARAVLLCDECTALHVAFLGVAP